MEDHTTQDPPDYEYWGQFAGWSVEEAAALLLDINPDSELLKSADANGLKNYHRLKRLLQRAVEMEELASPEVPRDLLSWAKSNRLHPPTRLAEVVRKGKPLRNWKTRYRNMRRERDALQSERDELLQQLQERTQEINEKAKTSLLKIIGGMARAKFEYSTKANPHTVSKIKNALDVVGADVSENTLRKYLMESSELFDDQLK